MLHFAYVKGRKKRLRLRRTAFLAGGMKGESTFSGEQITSTNRARSPCRERLHRALPRKGARGKGEQKENKLLISRKRGASRRDLAKGDRGVYQKF